jgi:hypothetical protein
MRNFVYSFCTPAAFITGRRGRCPGFYHLLNILFGSMPLLNRSIPLGARPDGSSRFPLRSGRVRCNRRCCRGWILLRVRYADSRGKGSYGHYEHRKQL